MDGVCFDVSGLTTSYKDFCLKSVNFRLTSGNIMGLIGASGSGKSTLIDTLVGLKKADRGSIKLWVNGGEEEISRHVGYSPQGNSLFPYLTLKENILTFGKLRGLRKQIIMERMDILLKHLRLTNAEDKKIVELSGGMAKRADVIVALLHNPLIVMLDEPFSGLDLSVTSLLWKVLHTFQAQGRIVIISSHMLPDIKKNCTYLSFISEGVFYNYSQMIAKMRKSHYTYLEELFMGV